MFKLSLRTILSHKRRLLSTVASIVLGVAFLVGTFVFTDSLQRTFDDLFSSVYRSTDVVVRSSEEIDLGQGASQRGRISDTLIDAVRQVPGVASASGSVSGYARIIGRDGEPLGVDQGSPNFGMDISDDPASAWVMREGRVPTVSTEMAMDASSYADGDFAIGDQVTVISQRGAREFTLVGVVGFGTADSPVGSKVALFDLATAQDFVGQAGQIDEVLASGDGSLDQTTLAARVAAAMPDGTETMTGQELADDSSDQLKSALGFFNTLLMVFAVVALFVGSFIIYNTFSIIVAQRKRENAVLRAIGASERQVMSALLLEALIMGIVGSLVGFGAGFVMAVLLRDLLEAVGIDLPSGGLVLLPRTIVVSFAVGMLITVLSAVLPARRGSKVPPIAALRDEAVEQTGFSHRRLLSGASLAAIAVTLIVVGLIGSLAVLGAGVALLFIALFVLGPLIARPVSRALGAPLARWRGIGGELARENSMRNPKRTARTAAALMVGVALVVAITVFASSTKASIRSVFGKQFVGDFVVSTQTFGFGGLPVSLAGELGAVDGVAAATGIQLGFARIDGRDSGVTVIDPSTVVDVFDVGITEGSMDDLDAAGIMVSRSEADDRDLALGDPMTLQFLDGSQHDVSVVGIYDKDELVGEYAIAKELYALSGTDQYDFSVFITLESGASSNDVESQLRPLVEPYAFADLQSRVDYIESQAKQIDTFVNLVYGLLALAVIIAVFGIANTLSLSVYERTRELGLLRAVGATRSQVRSMVRWEAVITALLGAVQGMIVGILLGWAVIVSLRDEGFTSFTVPVVTMVIVLVIAIVCGVAAAARPARRASRLDVLEAISAA